MGKLPYISLFTGDWIKDPELSKCSPATRGIWIDALCAMHESSRSGKLSGTPDQLARVCRCSTADMQSALDELSVTKTAKVTEHNKIVTLENRRMLREDKVRKDNALRQARFKSNTKSNAKVISPLSFSYSKDPPTPLKISPQIGGSLRIFLDAYPAHRRTRVDKIREAFMAINPDTAMLGLMLAALEAMKESDEWTRESGRFIPGAENWLAGRSWESFDQDPDELPPDPPGADPKPPPGCDWARDEAGEIIHPMRAVSK